MLTKEETIEKHRELWDWLSKNPDKWKFDWPKWSKNGGEVERLLNYCFACEYAGQIKEEGNICFYCPLDWPGVNCILGIREERGLYRDYREEKNPYKRKKLAEQIRDLPEK